MAAIHTESSAIFARKNVNVSEEKISYVPIQPVNPITPGQPIEFVIPGTGDQYISLKDTQLWCEVEFQLTKKLNTPYKLTKPLTPIGYKGPFEQLVPLLSSRRRRRHANTNTFDSDSSDDDEEPPSKRTRRGAAPTGAPPTPPTTPEKETGATTGAAPAAAAAPTAVNLSSLDPLERQAVVENYEKRAAEWNHYAASKNLGKKDYVEHCFPIDAFFHTMWKQVDVFMNQQLVSTQNTMYAYKSYIETILGNTASQKKFQLRNIGYTGPEAHLGKPISIQTDAHPFQESRAIEKRKERWVENKRYFLVGYPTSDMWNIQAAILNGVQIDIKLYPNSDKFRMMAFPPGVEATLVLRNIMLSVCKMRMAPKIVIGQGNVLRDDEEDARYPFIRTETRAFNVVKGSRSVTLENPYQSNIPARMIVGMVRADAKAGSFSRNPLNFQHFNLASAGYYINDEPIPRRPFEVDCERGNFFQVLHELYTALGHNRSSEDLGITNEEYTNGSFLIPFDVQPTAAGNLSYLAKRTGGHSRVELTWHEPLPCNICVITYAIFPSILEIDYPRNVRVVDLEKPRRFADMKGSKNKRQAAVISAPVA